jgi:glycosidase
MKKISLALLLLLLVLSGCTKKEGYDFESINPQNDIYYEIFVRSFADSDNDGIGDLNGVTENLDYLEELGVTGVWLMPINLSNSYHGYDVLDYYAIDPDYGTMTDFENLVDEAAKRDITIMIDLVINHTSDQHDWFIKSRANNPEFRDYYIWEGTTAFSSFVGGMVDLNLANEDVKAEIKNIFDFYLERGVRGFRLDAAKHFFDKPGVAGVTLKNAFFMMEMNAYIKETYPDSFITAEVYEPNYEFNVDYYLGPDSILDFTVQRAIQERIGVGSSTYLLSSTFEKVFDAYRKVDPNFVASPFITNHDMDRIASMSGFNGAQGMERMKLAANVLLTLPGSPFIYYGDELGMKGVRYEGTNIPGYGVVYDEYRRSPFIWGNPAIETTWLPSDGSNDTLPTYAAQKDDDTSLFNHYRTMIELRKDNPALMYGNGFIEWDGSTGSLQGYYRSYSYEDFSQNILVIHNISSTAKTVEVDYDKILYGSLELGAFETVILEVEAN